MNTAIAIQGLLAGLGLFLLIGGDATKAAIFAVGSLVIFAGRLRMGAVR